MDLSQFLFTGYVGNFEIGSKINSAEKVVQIQNQDGDIPSLYEFTSKGSVYEISCINEIIVGLSLKLDRDMDMIYSIQKDNKVADFGIKTDLINFIKFLNELEIDWKIDPVDTGQRSLGILLKSKTKVMYSFEKEFFGFYQVVNFDMELYNKIRLS